MSKPDPIENWIRDPTPLRLVCGFRSIVNARIGPS